MKISFGIHLAPGTPFVRRRDLSRVADLVKMAEDYGAEAIGTYDSAFIGDDAYVRTALIAAASTRARVGLRPTNPITREPQVMASFLASIDSLTEGRAFMDIASWGQRDPQHRLQDRLARPHRRLRQLCARPAGGGRVHLSKAASAGALVLPGGAPSHSHFHLRRGAQNATFGRQNRRWSHRGHGTFARSGRGYESSNSCRARAKPDAIRLMSTSGSRLAPRSMRTTIRRSRASRRRCHRF